MYNIVQLSEYIKESEDEESSETERKELENTNDELITHKVKTRQSDSNLFLKVPGLYKPEFAKSRCI